mmetsp:Transcript_18789/g.32895  ORF Transcript_18789/g.32895 Transcript_18789/m.32895 type:complete len:105 (-) Transcript_18789:123-437(-)
MQRMPQSEQSVPNSHVLYCEPCPPSSQSPSDAPAHVSEQSGEAHGIAPPSARTQRAPQSVQSVPSPHKSNVLPSPPSSQPPSDEKLHVSSHNTLLLSPDPRSSL